MTVKYNVEKLSRIVEDIRTVMGVSLSVVDTSYRTICAARNDEAFCRRIASSPEGRSRCECSDTEMLRMCRQSGAPVSHICHAGLRDTAVPILKDNVVAGYIFIGRVRPTEAPEGICERLSWLGESEVELARSYAELPYFTEGQMSAMINLVSRIIFDGAVEIEYEGVLERAVDYIDRNISSPLTVDILCHKLYVSKNKLYSIFREHKNMTVNDYIWQCRLKRAKEYLAYTDKPLPELSSSVGIDNYTYFCRLFKRETGVSPTTFRKLNKNPNTQKL